MKWFKHMSDGLDDPFVYDLVTKFGGDGYLAYFGCLEVISKEFDINSPGFCRISQRFLSKKLQLSRQKMLKILNFCDKNDKILISLNEDYVDLNCPKLKEYCDEYTQKQLTGKSGQTPDKSGINSGIEVEADVEVEADLSKKASKYPKELPSEEEIKEGSETKIEDHVREITGKLYQEKIFPKVHSFVNKMKKQNKNPRAILHVLSRCYLSKPEEPWGFCLKIMETEDGNYNERDYRKTHKKDDK